MITLYSGTPGSGKSYHAVRDIWQRLHRKNKRNRVIANFPVSGADRLPGHFDYWDNEDISIANLVAYARANHLPGVEGQTLLVIDEAQCIFNSRDWNGKGIIAPALKRKPESRMDWIKFFSQHRKLGFNVCMIAQSDKMIDKQIRVLIEYDVKHLKINNGFFCFLPFTCFLAVEKWYGQNMKLGTEMLVYHKKIARLYDSYALFDAQRDELGLTDGRGNRVSGGSPPPAQQPPSPLGNDQAVDLEALARSMEALKAIDAS